MLQQHHRIHGAAGLRVCFEMVELCRGSTKNLLWLRHNCLKWKLCRGNRGDHTNPTIASVITEGQGGDSGNDVNL